MTDRRPTAGFFTTLGRLPGTGATLSVIIVAGLCEGFGLALFVPVITLLEDEGAALGGSFEALRDLLATVGLRPSLFVLLVIVVTMIAGSFAVAFLKDRMIAAARHQHLADLRRGVIESLVGAHFAYTSRRATGEVVNELLVECGRAAAALAYQVMVTAVAVQVAIFAAISLALSWRLFLLCIAISAGIGLIIWPLIRRSRRFGEATNTANQNYAFHVVDYLKGTRLIRVTGSESRILDKLGGLNAALTRVLQGAEVTLGFTHFAVQTALVIVLAVIIALARETLAVPTPVLLTFLLIMARIAPRLVQFQQFYQAYSVYAPALAVTENTIAEARAAAEDRRPDGRPFVQLDTGIALEAVSFRYPDDDKGAIESMSLTVPRRAMIGIVGASGAGKSTLIDLIAGLYRPDTGRITIDGIDLRELDLVAWRRRIGYVTQDVILFNDTLRNNLLFSHHDASPADVVAAIEVAHLGPLIAELPHGLDTVVGEGGVRLSGGQRQRVALARALVGRPELLLLDEATSALDTESERLIQDSVERIARELTMIVVAHRLATVRNADHIYVIDHGRIVESGSHAELLARGDRYARLHGVQVEERQVG
ncbi:MAG: ABC transporter ATP-binding protein [Rhodospirillales bacterium]|nr:ABC transporter ATP-binding protein [Rhodospirillales bacterium]